MSKKKKEKRKHAGAIDPAISLFSSLFVPSLLSSLERLQLGSMAGGRGVQ
jgi:hypothetical protein